MGGWPARKLCQLANRPPPSSGCRLFWQYGGESFTPTMSAVIQKSYAALACAATSLLAATALNAGPSKATVWIDIIPNVTNPTTQSTFRIIGHLDRAKLGTPNSSNDQITGGGLGASNGPGINTNTEIVRSSLNLTPNPAVSSTLFSRWTIKTLNGVACSSNPVTTNICNPFTGSISGTGANSTAVSASIQTNLYFNFGVGSTYGTSANFGIQNSYISGTEFANEFVVNRSLSGSPTSIFTASIVPRLEYILGNGELVVIGSNVVPAPLPLLGAGAAFGFTRRMRSRIRASRAARAIAAS
jgi:hypothetical protein